MALRKRILKRTSSLEEPLLAPDQAELDLPSTSHEAGRKDRAIVPRSINKYDWEQLWRSLVAGCVQSCTNVWKTLVQCLGSLLPIRISPSPVELNPEEAQQLDNLQQRIQIPYDPDNAEHQAMLHQALLCQLWTHAFPGEAPQLQSDRWKDMGWQGKDPATDFRGGGLISLQNLLFLATRYPSLFSALLHKSHGDRAQDIPLDEGGRGGEYPFAAAGVNFTHMLIELLGLRSEESVLTLPTGQGFCTLMQFLPDPFDEIYCLVFEHFDAMWLETGVQAEGKWGYFDFNTIKTRLHTRLAEQLSKHPQTLDELRVLLGS